MGVDVKMRQNTGHRGDGIALQQRQIKAVGGTGRINVIGKNMKERGGVKKRQYAHIRGEFNPLSAAIMIPLYLCLSHF